MPVPLSILDLAPINRGETAAESFATSVALARLAEKLGFERVWYAEHHNIPGMPSTAFLPGLRSPVAADAQGHLGAPVAAEHSDHETGPVDVCHFQPRIAPNVGGSPSFSAPPSALAIRVRMTTMGM